MRAQFLFLLLAAFSLAACQGGDIEVGNVDWGRDLDAAFSASGKSGRPVLVLFQEVPGCAGCRKFGKEVLSHPLIVEAIESEFEPVLVYNNRKEDAEVLKRFGEPAWNFQVIRFLDRNGSDIIPRRDKIWTTEALASRMSAALRKVGRPVPPYLETLSFGSLDGNLGTAAFAMYCFWTGEMKFGGIDGVLVTEAGFLEGREVAKITFDRDRISFGDLATRAASFDCADKVYTSSPEDAETAGRTRLSTGTLTNDYRPARSSDQKRQIGGTVFQKIDLSPVQSTKVNAFARSDPGKALQWLSPRQVEQLEQLQP